MNERIKELVEQANNDVSGNAFSMARYNEKFAELIVQECIQVCDRPLSKHMLPSDNIREHFGVE